MQRWSKKRIPLPILTALFAFLFVSFIIYNENKRHFQDLPTPAVPTGLFHTSLPAGGTATVRRKQRDLGDMDWSKACNSTRSYTLEGARIHSNQVNNEIKKDQETCDLFSGRWVFDNVSYPLYREHDCPYMSDQLAYTKHGRPDTFYQSWRWQPHDCNLKRWNATAMWEKLRGRRLMFVGDSLDRGQWISMVCLLESVVPANKRSMSPNAALTTFRAEEYNATVEFHWAPLLVKSNSDDPVNHRLSDRIIAPELLREHAAEWAKADILIFNTYLWWRQGNVRLVWSADDDGICEDLDGLMAMTFAMEAWADWIISNVNQNKKAFFVSISPTHFWSREWNPGSEGNCYHETLPIEEVGYWGSGSDLPTMQMVERVLGRLKSKVVLVNITQLSEYRKDGHPSIYRKFWETFSPEQLANPSSFSDCIHWCLPGVPDVWNELIFNLL